MLNNEDYNDPIPLKDGMESEITNGEYLERKSEEDEQYLRDELRKLNEDIALLENALWDARTRRNEIVSYL